MPSGGDNTMEYERERARARPGPCSSAPVLGASSSSMMARRHRGDRHLVRLTQDDVFPGGDDYGYERPRFLRELEERAEREERRAGGGDGDVDREDEESEKNGDGFGNGSGSMARWGVLEGSPTMIDGGEVCCEPSMSTSTRSMAPVVPAPPLRWRGEGEGDREFLDLGGESSMGNGSSTMGMRKQPLQYEGIPVPMLPVSQETPTRHRIVKSMNYGYGHGQVKRRRN